jgi:hypothetical protein
MKSKSKDTEKHKLRGEDIVLELENDAESANYHDLSSVYRSLYEILLEVVTEEEAADVMEKIKDRGGFLP